MQFDARLSEYKYGKIFRPLYKRLTPYAYWCVPAFLFAGIVAYVGGVYFNLSTKTNDFNWLGIVAFTLFASGFTVAILRYRRQLSSIDAVPYRQGITTVSFDETGMRFENSLSSLHYRWGAIVDVIEGAAATLVLVGDLEAIVIPDHTLPDSLSAEVFREQIHRYLLEQRG